MRARRRTLSEVATSAAMDFGIGTACAVGALVVYVGARAAFHGSVNYGPILDRVLVALFWVVVSIFAGPIASGLPILLFAIGMAATIWLMGDPPAIPRWRAVGAGVAYVGGGLALLYGMGMGITIAQVAVWMVVAPLLAPTVVAWGGAPLSRWRRA